MIIAVQAGALVVLLGALATQRPRLALGAWMLFFGLGVYQLVAAFA